MKGIAKKYNTVNYSTWYYNAAQFVTQCAAAYCNDARYVTSCAKHVSECSAAGVATTTASYVKASIHTD